MADEWDVDRSRVAWWMVAVGLALVLLYVLYSFIGTFVFGIFFYYATRPVYRQLKEHVSHSQIAVVISLFLLALPALLLVLYTIAIALQEFGRFAQIAELGQFQDVLGPYIDASTVARDPQQLLTGQNVGTLQGFLEVFVQYIGIIGTGLIHLFVILAIAYYLLRDDHKLSNWFRDQFGDEEGVLDAYLDRVDEDFHSVFFGNILNAVFTGSIGAIVYNLTNLIAPAQLAIPSPSLLGLLTGIASLIPIVGMKLVYFPVTAYLLATAVVADPAIAWFAAVFFVVSLVIVDTIPDLVLRPYVSGRNLHIGMVMLAYILGPLLFGWYGLFLGPMILVLIFHFGKVVLPELLSGEPIRPWVVDHADVDAETASETPPEFDETTPTDLATDDIEERLDDEESPADN